MTTQGPFRRADRALLFPAPVMHHRRWHRGLLLRRRRDLRRHLRIQRFVTFPRAARPAQNPRRASRRTAAKRSGSMWTASASRRGSCRRATRRAARRCSSTRTAMASSSTCGPTIRAALRDAGIGVLLVEYPGLRALRPAHRRKRASRRRLLAAYDWASHDPRVDARAHHRLRPLAGRRRGRATRRPPAAGGAGARVDVHQHRRSRARLRRTALADRQSSSTRARCSRSIRARC